MPLVNNYYNALHNKRCLLVSLIINNLPNMCIDGRERFVWIIPRRFLLPKYISDIVRWILLAARTHIIVSIMRPITRGGYINKILARRRGLRTPGLSPRLGRASALTELGNNTRPLPNKTCLALDYELRVAYHE